VVAQLAEANDLPALEVRSPKDESRQTLESVWILMSRNRDFLAGAVLGNQGVSKRVLSVPDPSGARMWTDDYNNLFQVMRWIPN
jgi:hypothetical protein